MDGELMWLSLGQIWKTEFPLSVPFFGNKRCKKSGFCFEGWKVKITLTLPLNIQICTILLKGMSSTSMHFSQAWLWDDHDAKHYRSMQIFTQKSYFKFLNFHQKTCLKQRNAGELIMTTNREMWFIIAVTRDALHIKHKKWP